MRYVLLSSQEAPAYAGTIGELHGLSTALRSADVLLQMLQLRQEATPGSIAGNNSFLPQITSMAKPCLVAGWSVYDVRALVT